MESRGDRYLMIDGLRGVASLAVFVFHAWMLGLFDAYLSKTNATWLETAVINRGQYGVEVFFVLSGFVMAHSQRNAELSWRSAGRFVLRRSLRLDPPYFIATALMILTVGVVPAWRTLLTNAVYAQGIAGQESILPPGWSLCYECQFYLALFALLALSHRIGGERFAQVVSALLAVVSFIAFVQREDQRGIFVNLWWMFFAGMLAYWTVRGSLHVRWFALAVVALLIASAWCSRHGRERVIVGVVTAGLIVIAAERGKLSAWLAGPFIQWAGRISYSLYLLHWPLILLATRWLPWRACPWVAVPVILGAAWIMRLAVEEPGMRLGKRWTAERHSPRQSPVPQSPALSVPG